MVTEASAEEVSVVFKSTCFFPALTFAVAPDEFLAEVLSFFDEADKLPLPLMCALPEALTLVLLSVFLVLLMAAVAVAVVFAFFALNVALADAVLFAAAAKAALAVAFALLALAFIIALPFAAVEPLRLALVLDRSALPFELSEPLTMVLPLPALTLVEEEVLTLPSFLLSVKLNELAVAPVALTEAAWL